MLRWAILFLLITAISGIFGFGLIPDYEWTPAKVIFFVSLTFFILSACVGLLSSQATRIRG